MSDTPIDTISSKSVFKAKLFEVDEYAIKYKNGREVTHHVAKRHPTVNIFPITSKNEIYLVQQYRYTLKKVSLEAVAGFVDPGESSLQAAKRELKEETGIIASSWEEISKLDMSASVFQAQAHIFLARDLEFEEATPEEDEEIIVVKMPLKEAITKVMTGEITTSATVTGLLLIEKLLKR